MTPNSQAAYVEKQVTYTLNLNGQIIVIENVPARVNEETGANDKIKSVVQFQELKLE